MALITQGRIDPDKGVGGTRNAFFINYNPVAFTVANGEVTGFDVSVTAAFKFELVPDGNLFNSVQTADKNAGTNFYAQTATLIVKKLDKASNLEFQLMGKSRPHLIIEDNNGKYHLLGEKNGLTVNVDAATGGTHADFNGYTATITGSEVNPAPILSETAVTALLAIVSATNIDPDA